MRCLNATGPKSGTGAVSHSVHTNGKIIITASVNNEARTWQTETGQKETVVCIKRCAHSNGSAHLELNRVKDVSEQESLKD